MSKALGIIVRSEPYSGRAGRERLDPALAAASLEIPLEVFFIGDGVLHLLVDQRSEFLPAAQYTKAWGALTGLSDAVALYADSGALERMSALAGDLGIEVQVLDSAAIAKKMNECRAVIHV